MSTEPQDALLPCREAFEKHLRIEGVFNHPYDFTLDDEGEYKRTPTRLMWSGWQAALSLRKKEEYDSRLDGTGLDDGPKLPFAVIMQTKRPLIIKAWQEGLSARACARVFDVSHEMAAQCVKSMARALPASGLDEPYVWQDISEYHEDYGDCLFLFFIGEELQGAEWTSPLTVDGPIEQWAYDRAIFKRVSAPTEEIQRLLTRPLPPAPGETV